MANRRPLHWILGGAAALAVAAVLAWRLLGAGPPADPAPRAPDVPRAPDQEAHAPAAPRAPAPALPPAHEHLDHSDENDSALVDTPAALPAPPGEDEIVPRPEAQALTPEEQRARRQASIDLLDRNIERLEAERKVAEASGDTRTAERNRIRVARMRERRAVLAAEADAASP